MMVTVPSSSCTRGRLALAAERCTHRRLQSRPACGGCISPPSRRGDQSPSPHPRRLSRRMPLSHTALPAQPMSASKPPCPHCPPTRPDQPCRNTLQAATAATPCRDALPQRPAATPCRNALHVSNCLPSATCRTLPATPLYGHRTPSSTSPASANIHTYIHTDVGTPSLTSPASTQRRATKASASASRPTSSQSLPPRATLGGRGRTLGSSTSRRYPCAERSSTWTS